MAEPLTISTEREGVIVRELWTDADDRAYNESYNASRAEIEVFDPDSVNKHRTIEATRDARLEAGAKLRMGIWDKDRFVGSINATPDEEGIEIGYWTDSRYAGNGYATLATRALANKFPAAHAEVMEGNDASARVLEKAGFRQRVAKELGQLSFAFDNPVNNLFPQLSEAVSEVPKGEYSVRDGTDAPIKLEGRLRFAAEGSKLNHDLFPGVHARGVYVGPERAQHIVSFLYHKLGPDGELETSERAIILEGIGYGEHPGHKGQPPTWYLIGPQVGTIDHETGAVLTMAEAGEEIPAKHFSMACMTDGPFSPPMLANPR